MITAVPTADGFTYPQVLRIIAEELTTLPPKYYQLLIFIAARTYRFGKKAERIPLTHFTDGIETDSGWIQHPVGVTKNAVSTGLKELEDAGIIEVVKCRNNVKKMGLSIAALTEGVDEMLSRLRHGKKAKQNKSSTESQESYPTVSLNVGNQYPKNRETSIPNIGKPNIRSRSLSLKNNNCAEALNAVVDKAKAKSESSRQRKVSKQPTHKQVLATFQSTAKELHPTLNLSSPTPAAIRNMRLALKDVSLPDALEFAKSTSENWESIIIHNLSFLHQKNNNLHVAPCVTTFGLLASKFWENHQRGAEKQNRHSRVVTRSPKLSVVPSQVPDDNIPQPTQRKRTMTKQERCESQGIPYVAATKTTNTSGKLKAQQDKFEQEIAEVMRTQNVDYATASDIVTFGD